MRSSKLRLALLIIVSIMTVVFLSGVVAAIVTDKSPYEWFKKDDVIVDEPIVDEPVVDEPVVEEVLPLVASNEEEMNALLVEENVGRTVTYTGENVWTKGSPFVVGEEISVLYFNTAIEPSFSGLTWEYNSSNGALESAPYILSIGHISFVPYELSSMGLGEGYALIMVNVPIYSSVVVPMGSFGDVGPGWIDWDAEGISIDQGVVSFGSAALVVQDVQNQDLFSSFISKEPFEILYENNVEYLIVANENGGGCHFEMID